MRVLIVGGGQVGSCLAGLLLQAGHQITVIESRAAAIEPLQRAAPGAACFHGSGTDPGVLEAAGIRAADLVVATTGSDETNLVIASLARFAFAAPRAAARINSPANTWMFTPAMGVDVALDQADVMAHLIAQAVV